MFEKVLPAHVDKVADRIAGALVDLAYEEQENPKVAVEVLIGHGRCFIVCESSVRFDWLEVKQTVDRIVGNDETILEYVERRQDEHLARNQDKGLRCGDNGIFKGCPITEEQRKLTDTMRAIYEKYPYDGKAVLDNDRIILCQSHVEDYHELLPFLDGHSDYLINPLGPWTGGPDVDTGCVGENELVATTDGLKRMKSIDVGDIVYTKEGIARVCNVFDKGQKRVVTVSDARGHEVTVTPDHPFLVLRDGEYCYIEACDLREGDLLVRLHEYPQTSCHKIKRRFKCGRGDGRKLTLNTELKGHAYFLGYLVGDGWYNTDTGEIFFSVGGDDEAEAVKEVIRDNWDVDAKDYKAERIAKDGTIGFDRKICMFSKSLCKVLDDLGFEKGAANKAIPNCILTANDYAKAAFLSGLFDADGCCRVSESGRDCGKSTLAISLVSSSRKLVNDVSAMLGSMGIQTTVAMRSGCGGFVENKYGQAISQANDSYSLSIPGEMSKRKFMNSVGFGLERKRKWASIRDREFEFEDHREFPCYMVAPLINKDAYLKYRYGFEKDSDAQAVKSGRNISYRRLSFALDLYGKYKDSPEYKAAEEMMRFDFSRFEAAEDGGLAHVYDISVDGVHNFVAGGFIVHNCTNRKLGSDMGDAVTGGGLWGKDMSKADVSVNIACHLLAQAHGQVCTASCAIGDEEITFRFEDEDMTITEPYENVVQMARNYVNDLGGFEKLAEWGLV